MRGGGGSLSHSLDIVAIQRRGGAASSGGSAAELHSGGAVYCQRFLRAPAKLAGGNACVGRAGSQLLQLSCQLGLHPLLTRNAVVAAGCYMAALRQSKKQRRFLTTQTQSFFLAVAS